MSKITTTQRSTQTKISKALATLLVSSGFVMTLPMNSAFAAANPPSTVGVVQCGNGQANQSEDCNLATQPTASINNLSVKNLTVGTLTVISAVVVTSANASYTSLSAGSITAGTVGTTNLTAVNGSITSLTSGTISTTNITATSGSINSLTASNASVGTLSAGSVSAGTISTTNITAASGSVSNLTTVNFSTTNLNAGNANISNLNAGNANISNLTAANTNTTNLTAGNTIITDSLTVRPGAAVDMGGNRVQGVVAGVQDNDGANMSQLRAVEKLAKQQGAIAAAATAIPQVAGAVGETTVGAGLGSSGGYAAVAVGISARISEDLIVKSNVGFSGSTKSIGIGFGYTFK